MGLLRFTPKGWDAVVKLRDNLTGTQCDQMHMTGTLQMLIDTGFLNIKGLSYQGEWGEVDSDVDLRYYHKKK